jgi:predicted ferric reductase
LPYEWWLLIHGLFSLLVVFVGLVHLLQVGFYVSELWQQAFWVISVTVSMGLLVYIRLIRPLSLSKSPYKVLEIREEAQDVWTIEVEAENHPGMEFRAGQFAWLTLKSSPFTLEQNPFSFSSSDQSSKKISFTIKELGDFSEKIKKLSLCKRVYLDGPHGAFVLNKDQEVAAFMVAGGIGITPFMSMLRSAKDRGEKRKFVLIYANNTIEDITFQQEIEVLKAHLQLTVVYVLSEPPEDWNGEEGFVTSEILQANKIQGVADTEYFVCGPTPVMDIVETTISGWGVPTRKIKSERFEIV